MQWLAELVPGFSTGQLLLTWIVILLAAILRAFTGFGFALAAVPAFALLMEPTSAVVLSVSLSLGIGITSARSYWGQVPIAPMLPMLALSLLGTLAGTALLAALSPRDFQMWIGIAVIAACTILTFYHPMHHRPRPVLGGITGLTSGILNGAFAIPGPPVIIYAMATEAQPRRARAMLITFFTFSALIALVSYAARGLVNLQSMWLFLFSFPAMLAGDKLGFALFRRMGNSFYRRIAIAALFAIGISTLARALS
jgi:uncharacterized membrane protein YfcA